MNFVQASSETAEIQQAQKVHINATKDDAEEDDGAANNKVKLTVWRDVAVAALAARTAGKNLCPGSLPAQKGE
jgi:hypothetical protein